MNIKTSTLRKMLNNFLRDLPKDMSEYETIATGALKKSGYDKVVLFTHNDHLVMINTIASLEAVASGVILNDEGTEIIGFQNSEDRKSVTTDALARCLIMESINDESDILRLRILSKQLRNWIIHYISNETSVSETDPNPAYFPEYLCNIHTHGMNAYTHKDFQIVLDIGKDGAVYLLNTLAEKVRDGEVFTAGERIEGVYPDCEIKLAAATEGGREVLRVLVPDENNRFPDEEGCSYPYSEQIRVFAE